MFKKAISKYTIFIVAFIFFCTVFALLMVRMFTAQAECETLQRSCASKISDFCLEWYGNDKSFEDQPPNGKYVWKKEKENLNCAMREAQAKFLDFCYVYNGTKSKGESCNWPNHECEAVEWTDKVDCYCKPYKEFCENLVEEAKKE
jgi:hypothetical protein